MSLREPGAAALLGLLLLLLAGCARYQPAPVSPAQTAAALEGRSLADSRLKAFLEQNSAPPETWPLRQWDGRRLVLAALYFHPDLEVSRAQWRVAQAGEITAGARPNPTVNLGPQYAINSDIGASPWLMFLDFDIPIETAGKRGHRLAQSRHLSEAARLNIVSTAWQVRGRLRDALNEYVAARQRMGGLRTRMGIEEQVEQRLEQKQAAGALATAELLPQRVALQKSRLDLADAERAAAEARARVAGAVGLPLAALEAVELPSEWPEPPAALEQLTSAEARRLALQSRPDILAGLAEYEAAQSALQLEIARQYPDLHLGPGYEYDQGENKFGFQLAAELPLFNRNQGPIAQAEARRAAAAARFVALQSRVIGEIDLALASAGAAGRQVAVVDSLLATSANSGIRSVNSWLRVLGRRSTCWRLNWPPA